MRRNGRKCFKIKVCVPSQLSVHVVTLGQGASGFQSHFTFVGVIFLAWFYHLTFHYTSARRNANQPLNSLLPWKSCRNLQMLSQERQIGNCLSGCVVWRGFRSYSLWNALAGISSLCSKIQEHATLGRKVGCWVEDPPKGRGCILSLTRFKITEHLQS